MRFNKTKSVIMGLSIVAMLLVGIGSTSANAQGRRRVCRPHRGIVYRHYDPFWYRYYDPFWSSYYPRQIVDPIAYQKEKGYKEGKDEGKDDARKGLEANATGNKDYLKSSSIHFREAFIQGYNDGYQEKTADLREKGRD